MEGAITSATRVLQQAGRELLSRRDTASVLGSLVAEAPESVENEGRLHNLFLIFRLGVRDLGAALTWAVYQLSAHAEWQERVGRSRSHEWIAAAARSRPTSPRESCSKPCASNRASSCTGASSNPSTSRDFTFPSGWIVRICRLRRAIGTRKRFPDPRQRSIRTGSLAVRTHGVNTRRSGSTNMPVSVVDGVASLDLLVAEMCRRTSVRTTSRSSSLRARHPPPSLKREDGSAFCLSRARRGHLLESCECGAGRVGHRYDRRRRAGGARGAPAPRPTRVPPIPSSAPSPSSVRLSACRRPVAVPAVTRCASCDRVRRRCRRRCGLAPRAAVVRDPARPSAGVVRPVDLARGCRRPGVLCAQRVSSRPGVQDAAGASPRGLCQRPRRRAGRTGAERCVVRILGVGVQPAGPRRIPGVHGRGRP